MHQEDPKKSPPSGGPKRDHDPKKDPLTGGPRRTPYIGALGKVLIYRKQGEDLARHPLGSQGLATLVNIKEAKRSNKPRVATKPSCQKGS